MIDLTGIPIHAMRPVPVRLGGVVRSALNGVAQNIDRLGSRWSFAVQTSVMAVEPDGRTWASLLDLAARQNGKIAIRQPGFVVGNPGAPSVASPISSGRIVPLRNIQPGYAFRVGQWVTITVGGVGYLDRITSPAVASGDGTASIALLNLLRAPLTTGVAVEVANPWIEGTVDGDFGGEWELDETTSFAFTITEDA